MRRVNDEDEARRDTMNLHQISDYSIVHGMLLRDCLRRTKKEFHKATGVFGCRPCS